MSTVGNGDNAQPDKPSFIARHRGKIVVGWILANIAIIFLSFIVYNALGGAIVHGFGMDEAGADNVHTVSIIGGLCSAVCFLFVFNGILFVLRGMIWGFSQIPKMRNPSMPSLFSTKPPNDRD